MENGHKQNIIHLSREDKEDKKVIDQTSQAELLNYFQLSALLLSEQFTARLSEIGYIVGETTDNLPQSLSSAATALNSGNIKTIAVLDPKSPEYNYGYPGPKYCLEELINFGVPKDKITVISSQKPLQKINTSSELEIVAEYLKETNYKGNFVLIAPWFHILRSYITFLSALKENADKIIVNVLSVPLSPYEEVVHSQGIQKGTRLKIFTKEIAKCIKYENLLRIEEALKIHQNQHLRKSIDSQLKK